MMAVGRVGRRLARSPLLYPWYNAAISLVLLIVLALFARLAWQWGVVDATLLPRTAADCLQASGACWAVVQVKWRFILFGFYPAEETWRVVVVLCLAFGLMLVSAFPRAWTRPLVLGWSIGVVLAPLLLLGGGPTGLRYVAPDQWSGLVLTVLLAVGATLIAVPLGTALALARSSTLGPFQSLAVAFIELVRGVPLVTALFVASVVLPLFLPADVSIPKIVRALLAIAVFMAAYVAEAVRAGLQAMPRGQTEAAAALGLGYWRTQFLIVLPQAFKIALPGLINAFLDFLQATSLVVIIGLFDLLGTTRAAIAESIWQPFYGEAYMAVAAIYFVICFSVSRYAAWLDAYLQRSNRR